MRHRGHPVVNRRHFLAISAAAVTACSTDGSDRPSQPEGSAESDASTTTPHGAVTAVDAPPWTLDADPFVLGIASGDPTDSAIVLWTRLAPSTGGALVDSDGNALGDVEIAVDVATDDTFSSLVVSEIVTADAGHAHSVHFDATGLEADRWYWYRFRVGDATSVTGRTRTAPAPDDPTDRWTIAVASCQRFEDGYYNAWRDVTADDSIDLVVFLGDYIYEGAGGDISPTHPRNVTGPECTTLEQYRDRYAQYRSDPELRAAHERLPWAVVWDDHEVENNYAGRDAQDSVGGDPAAQEQFAIRRAAAYTAWWEHQPVRLDPPQGDVLEIRRALRWGSLANLMLLDTRQNRSDQPCGDVALSFEPACPEAADPNLRMLSADDEQWLLDGLTSSRTVWNVIGNQTVMTDLRVGDAVLNYDQWDGYAPQRERILTAIEQAAINNVVVVTGDIHLGGVGRVTLGDGADSRTIATELVGTSISSDAVVPADLAAQAANLLPDVDYLNGAQRGWCKVTFTPTSGHAEFRVVDDNLIDGSEVRTDARFDMSPTVPGATRAE